MSMLKDMAKMKEWSEVTDKYISDSSALLGEVSDQNMAQAMLPPLRVLKFYNGKLGDMLSRNEPKRASIGDDGGMYTVPDNVVQLAAVRKRKERWNALPDGSIGNVRIMELD